VDEQAVGRGHFFYRASEAVGGAAELSSAREQRLDVLSGLYSVAQPHFAGTPQLNTPSLIISYPRLCACAWDPRIIIAQWFTGLTQPHECADAHGHTIAKKEAKGSL
jgi:hypothetical protein